MKLYITEDTLSDLFTDQYVTYRIEKVNELYDDVLRNGKNNRSKEVRTKKMELIRYLKEVLRAMNKDHSSIYLTNEYRADITRLNYFYDRLSTGGIETTMNYVTGILKKFENYGYPFR